MKGWHIGAFKNGFDTDITMIGVLLLIAALGVAMQGFFQKIYNNSTAAKVSVYSFNLLVVATALVVFLPQVRDLNCLKTDMVFYSAGFSVTYFCSLWFILKAIEIGSLSLSSLINSYALIIPTIFGVIFLDEPVGILTVIGFVLTMVSLYFVGDTKKSEHISKKWILYISLSFLGNGLCSTIQKFYQIKSGGLYKAEFMSFALILAVVAMSVFIFAREKSLPIPKIKNGGLFAVCCGLFNGLVNLLTMYLAKFPAPVVYPTISGGSIIIAFIFSKYIFKEKLSTKQTIGFLIGIVAVVVLNL